MSDFSRILGGLRREAGLSQRKAAQELGVSQALLSHYENGAREPKLEFVVRVCSYYGVTADYILGRSSADVVMLRRCPDGADTLIEAVREIFTELRGIGDAEVIDLTLKYLSIPAENIRALLKNPGTLYDPLRDAELKTIEAQLVASVRRANKKTNNQGEADD